MESRHTDDEYLDDPLYDDTERVRQWIRRIATIIGVGIPVFFVVVSILSGYSRDTIIWNGIMGAMLGLIVWYGISPQSFALFPPGRRRRRRK